MDRPCCLATTPKFPLYFPIFAAQFKKTPGGKIYSPTRCQIIPMSHLTADRKKELFASHGESAANTGSIEAQVAMLTERILHISSHMKTNKKDFNSNRGLVNMVGRRKRLLSYLSRTNLQGYRALIEKLGLRK